MTGLFLSVDFFCHPLAFPPTCPQAHMASVPPAVSVILWDSWSPSSLQRDSQAALASDMPVCFPFLCFYDHNPGICPTGPSASHANFNQNWRCQCPSELGVGGKLCFSSASDGTQHCLMQASGPWWTSVCHVSPNCSFLGSGVSGVVPLPAPSLVSRPALVFVSMHFITMSSAAGARVLLGLHSLDHVCSVAMWPVNTRQGTCCSPCHQLIHENMPKNGN